MKWVLLLLGISVLLISLVDAIPIDNGVAGDPEVRFLNLHTIYSLTPGDRGEAKGRTRREISPVFEIFPPAIEGLPS